MNRRLALVGYGKMGRLIDQLADQYNFEVVVRLRGRDNPECSAITAEAFSQVDAAIEFSTPGAATGNLKRLAKLAGSNRLWHHRLVRISS